MEVLKRKPLFCFVCVWLIKILLKLTLWCHVLNLISFIISVSNSSFQLVLSNYFIFCILMSIRLSCVFIRLVILYYSRTLITYFTGFGTDIRVQKPIVLVRKLMCLKTLYALRCGSLGLFCTSTKN